MKNILDETNSYERLALLNRFRQDLNRLCVDGYFGPSNAESCQQVAELIQKNPFKNEDSSNEKRNIEKRFFCNGFIGCKNGG